MNKLKRSCRTVCRLYSTIETKSGSINMADIDVSKYDLCKEGSATLLFPKEKVFYNPIQQYNRDLSSLAIRAFTQMQAEENAKKRNADEEPVLVPYANLLEALSASGLRAIRYSKECDLLQNIVANDISKPAVESIKLNCEYNGCKNVKPNEANAITHMSNNPSAYHIIDLDPYGTVSPFVDSAINSAKNGALMLVTCTDLGVLAGNGYPEKCYSLYGGVNVWGDATHESALRLVHGMIARTAAKYGVAIEPVLSLSIDFYVRVFIRVWRKPIKVKDLMSMNEIVVRCSGCHSTIAQPLGKKTDPEKAKGKNKYGLAKIEEGISEHCQFCDYTNHLCGPMWGSNLHNKDFIDKIMKLVKEEEEKGEESVYGTLKRVRGMLTMARNELGDSTSTKEEIHASQFYFSTSTISSVLKIPAPSIEDMCSALGNLGFKASLTHASTNCIKTDAPWTIIWFIGQQLAKRAKVDIERMSPTTAGYRILTNKTVAASVDLRKAMMEKTYLSEEESNKKTEDELLEWLFEKNEVSREVNRLRRIKIVRFQENPTKNWGPKARPK